MVMKDQPDGEEGQPEVFMSNHDQYDHCRLEVFPQDLRSINQAQEEFNSPASWDSAEETSLLGPPPAPFSSTLPNETVTYG